MEPSSPDPGKNPNQRYATTEKHAGEERWYILDNAASFMPALTDRAGTLVFRISATLTERVNLPALTLSLANLSSRFPYFLVELRRGFFWYYLEPLPDKVPRPVADSRYPCMNMRLRRHGRFLFRVRAYRSRIAVEFCHILTDGSGALTYLKAVIMEYYRLRGVETPDPEGIFSPDETPRAEESEDAFHMHFQERIPHSGMAKKAFHVPSLPLLPGQYRVTIGSLPLTAVLSKAKEYGATLTEFMVSIYMASLQDAFYALPGPVRRTMRPYLSIEVPVDLRRLFPSKTMRNFSLYVLPALDTRLGFYEFPEIVKRVHHFMQTEVHQKNISMQIARNVGGSRSIAVRMIPLALKGLAAKLVAKRMGEDTFTGLLSNLGPVKMPEPLAGRIERFEFIPAPSKQCKTNANLVSWNGRLYICFGSLSASTEIERLFFSRLSSMGLSALVESNM